jgi:ketopantoate reductase
MVQCTHCKSKTELCINGLPICLDCANRAEAKDPPEEQNIRAILQRELIAATARAHAATDAFHAILEDIPSALPHPDGTQLYSERLP